MNFLKTTKLTVMSLVTLLLLLISGQLTGSLQAAQAKQAAPKHYRLAATLETTQWGWLDPNETPKLTVNSGDIVSVETMMHSHDKIQPGVAMDEIVALRKANPGGGPHGTDLRERRRARRCDGNSHQKITPKPVGFNFNLPGKEFPTIGALADEFPEGYVKYFTFDLKKRQTELKPGIMIDLKPFPGTLAVGIDPNDPSPRKGGAKDPMAPVSTIRPWKNGSNMDLNEMQEGSTIFIPIFLKGGLVWTGDSHCRQGNGEVNLTAIECAYREIVMQLIVRKDMKIEWPRVETKTHWILMGFDEDLNKAMVNAVRETVDFWRTKKSFPWIAARLIR